jgi:hypothetical protein
MEFYIKKETTLPILKMRVVNDGRSSYNQFMELLETSSIYFTMVNLYSGIPKIVSSPAEIVNITLPEGSDSEYYIYYKFSKRDTNEVGRYQGQFLIKSDEGDLILPIREDLFINVQESIVVKNECC